MKKKSILIILILSCFMYLPTIANAEAETLGDLYDELESLKAQKEAQDNEKEMSEEAYNKTSKEIVETENEIVELNKRIDEATEKIAELEVQIAEKKEETDNILVFLQLSSGEKSYLEYIFKAKSFTDFIHRISVVEQLSKYNSDLIDEMNSLIKQNNELKEKLKKDIEEEEKQRKELQEKLKALGSKIAEIDDIVVEVADLIKGVEEEIQMYKDLGCTNRNDVLKTCKSGIPKATGFIRPIVKGTVTSKYGYRIHPVTGQVNSFHSGTDMSLANAEGTNIYPVASGVVAARIYRASCGGNMLFIYHNINGTNYTSVYMHLLSFEDDVQVGDIVTTNDVIGYMGGWSTSTSHGGYDSCTTGAHLHLTLAKGHVVSSYRSYLLDPATKIYFPSGWWYSRTW